VKYFVKIEGTEHTIELVERLGRLEVSFDGEPANVRYEEVDRLGQIAFYDGERAYGISIEGDAKESVVNVAGHEYLVEIEDERERAARSADRSGGRKGGLVKSVMPGVVVDLLVEVGQEVAQNQPLLILEAMKMQNEIRAAEAGCVKAIHVAKGDAVGNGAKLVTLSEAALEAESETEPKIE
jgi:biotin carboxyl carrier protein